MHFVDIRNTLVYIESALKTRILSERTGRLTPLGKDGDAGDAFADSYKITK